LIAIRYQPSASTPVSTTLKRLQCRPLRRLKTDGLAGPACRSSRPEEQKAWHQRAFSSLHTSVIGKLRRLLEVTEDQDKRVLCVPYADVRGAVLQFWWRHCIVKGGFCFQRRTRTCPRGPRWTPHGRRPVRGDPGGKSRSTVWGSAHTNWKITRFVLSRARFGPQESELVGVVLDLLVDADS